ncbi:MAG: A/G-specific adenine glycosylase [Saprospiraceae bacterium]|nr:A/G-specific adenine glycosylase [Saprospiraceae bacterium]
MLPRHFAETLTDWHHGNPRQMPWLHSKDPYIIWISEIILQQTRVSQGWEYFQKFVLRFPNLISIYTSDETEILTYWEGLGYYTRIRNIIKTTKILVETRNGIFPDSYEELLRLPGIGPYTASAIAGFAYNLPYPVMDGNVIRLMTRIFGITTISSDITNTKYIHNFLQQSISFGRPSLFNQAIMNFGALVCKPSSPLCPQCPFQNFCLAFQQNQVDSIPVKKVKAKKTNRYFHYFIIKDTKAHKTILQQRKKSDIWHLLFQFPLIETNENMLLSFDNIMEGLTKQKCELSHVSFLDTEIFHQTLTHQNIHFTLYKIQGIIKKIPPTDGYILVNISDLSKYAMPVLLKKRSKWLES